MTRQQIWKLLDYVPFIILVISAFILMIEVFSSNILFTWKHYLGLGCLFITSVAFSRNHYVGVITLGLTMIMGFFGILTFSPWIRTIWLKIKIGEAWVTIFYAQQIFILWTALHFIILGKKYFGIGTKEYWKKILNQRPPAS